MKTHIRSQIEVKSSLSFLFFFKTSLWTFSRFSLWWGGGGGGGEENFFSF